MQVKFIIGCVFNDFGFNYKGFFAKDFALKYEFAINGVFQHFFFFEIWFYDEKYFILWITADRIKQRATSEPDMISSLRYYSNFIHIDMVLPHAELFLFKFLLISKTFFKNLTNDPKILKNSLLLKARVFRLKNS